MMTPERWRQLNQIFEAALAQPTAERQAFLTRACAGDEELRRHVEAMLAADAQADLLLDRPAHEAAAELLSAETAVPHESEILSGRTIGSYRLIREIGRGGMGKVYLAHDERLDRRTALKLLPTRLTGEADRVARFQREARAASALNHPNILTIYDFGQEADRHYIAAEFVEGRTLRALIRQPGCTLPQALDLASQVASALAAAHAAGIIHRDIKPENLMLRHDGFVKVLDFGLAKLSEAKARDWDIFRTGESGGGGDGGAGRRSDGEKEEAAADRTFASSPRPPVAPSSAHSWATRPGLVLGTVAYMSPEQARGLEVDARSDLFSLGVVLYEMLTGERPFNGETPTDVLAALIERTPPPLPADLLGAESEVAARAELQRIVSRALAKPLDQRYQTANEMLEELNSLKQELAFTAKQRSGATGKTLRASAPTERPVLADLPTSDAAQIATRPEAKPRRWRGHGLRPRLAALALVALVLLAAGGILAARWFAARARVIHSIAVLPFVNVGGDPQMEHLPDGITESLMANFSQLPAMRVMARGTVFTYKGRDVDPRAVGAALKVEAVVMGRVVRQGQRLVVHAELVDTTDGAQLWSAIYQRQFADLWTVQEEITRELSAALRPRLSSTESSPPPQHAANNEAYQFYLLGNHLYNQATRETMLKALDYYHRAIALDPRYAPAYARSALAYAVAASQYLPPSEAIPKAREAALKAIALDERLPEAHSALARVKLWGDWDWLGAEQSYKRAIELNPNFADAFSGYASLLMCQKRFAEAWREARRAEALDLLSAPATGAILNVLYFSRQYDRMIEQCRKALEINSTVPFASGLYRSLGLALNQKQMRQAALAELRQAVALSRSDANLSYLAYVCAVNGQQAEALELLRELETQAARRHVSTISFARIYVGLGDKERALAWLRKGYEQRSDHLLVLGVDPVYDPLRSDPRFIELLRGLGLKP